MEVIQSIFVGPSTTGKSTLKHLLVHNVPKAVKTSTAVLETPEVVTKRSAMDFSSEQYAVQEDTVPTSAQPKEEGASSTGEEPPSVYWMALVLCGGVCVCVCVCVWGGGGCILTWRSILPVEVLLEKS